MWTKKRLLKETTLTKIGFILTIASFIIAVIAIVFVIINIQAIKNQNENAIRSERNERFKNAIEQLGNDKNAIVLGGIYTLHRIASEDKNYIENVFNILCSYVRETTTTESYQEKYEERPSEPIQTILNILCVNEKYFEIYRSSESKLKIDFSRANLTGADLKGANLTSAYLWYANLVGANLLHANLTDAYLGMVNLTGANLKYINFTDAILLGVNLTGARLIEANLINANLWKANLTHADLEKANLKSASSSLIDFNINMPFEERIRSRIGKEIDLSGIKNGYDPENPQFKGTPIFGSYTQKEAELMIKEYNDLINK